MHKIELTDEEYKQIQWLHHVPDLLLEALRIDFEQRGTLKMAMTRISERSAKINAMMLRKVSVPTETLVEMLDRENEEKAALDPVEKMMDDVNGILSRMAKGALDDD